MCLFLLYMFDTDTFSVGFINRGTYRIINYRLLALNCLSSDNSKTPTAAVAASSLSPPSVAAAAASSPLPRGYTEEEVRLKRSLSNNELSSVIVPSNMDATLSDAEVSKINEIETMKKEGKTDADILKEALQALLDKM